MSTAFITLPEQNFYAEIRTLRVGDLPNMRTTYDNYPEFQREKVWSLTRKRLLIDTMLRKLPLFPLIVTGKASDKDHQFLIGDGQQRLTAIIEFLTDRFTTLRNPDDPALHLIEPNKRFSELSPEAQEILTSSLLQIWVINVPEEVCLATYFRRLQQQQSLNLAEQLWTYRESVRQLVRPLMEHSFWYDMYAGSRTRKRTFLGCLYLLSIGLDQSYSTITPVALRSIATNTEGKLTPQLIETVSHRLDMILHLFAGTIIVSISEAIPLYQAVGLLESLDYNPKKSKTGCLSPWFNSVKENSHQARLTPGQVDILERLETSKHQIAFWSHELSKMLAVPGLSQINKKRTFNAVDRALAWQRQKGICPVCRRPVKLTDHGHHVVSYQAGGPTTADNCLLVHPECHPQADREFDGLLKSDLSHENQTNAE